MKIYTYDESGLFNGEHELVQDELPEAYHNAVTVAPPELGERYAARWNGADWTIENKSL